MSPVRNLDWSDDRFDHIARHGVLYFEVEEALMDQRRLIVRRGPADRNSEDTIYHVYGRSGAGRYLFVAVLRYGDSQNGLVLTARDLTYQERRRYRR